MNGSLITILYGSETGTGYSLSLDLYEYLLNSPINTQIYNIEQFKPSLIENDCNINHLLIWIISTTGQGQPSNSFKNIWKLLLQKKLTLEKPFKYSTVSILGLGDSSYPHYNIVAKRLSIRLQQLGAKYLLPLYLCDDNAEGGIGPQYVKWRTQLLTTYFGYNIATTIMTKTILSPYAPSPFTVDIMTGQPDNHLIPDKVQVVDAPLRLTAPSHWNDVRRLTLRVATQPGDVVWLWPTNEGRVSGALVPLCIDGSTTTASSIVHRRPVETVTEWMARHALPDQVLRIWGSGLRHWNGKALLMSQWLTWVFDPWSVAIPYYGVRVAAHYTSHTSPEAVERLRDLARNPFGAEVRSYVVEEFRTLAELFDDFSTQVSQIPLATLFSAIPLFHPRPYSVAQCHADGTSSVLVSLKQKRTPTHRLYMGRFSATLLQSPAALECVGRPGMLQCVRDWRNERGIFVTAGSGIGGVLSFFHGQQERIDWTLYHGCRDQRLDSLGFATSLTCLRKVTWAESRVPEAPFKYVWHALLKDSAEIWDILWGGNGFMVVVGSTVMARDVDSVLGTIIKLHGGKSHEDAVAMVKQKQLQGRILVDVWN